MKKNAITSQRDALDQESPAYDPIPIEKASPEELLLLALTGDPRGGLADGIEAAVVDLELLYETLAREDERWVASPLHQLQNRLRVLAVVARRMEAGATRAA